MAMDFPNPTYIGQVYVSGTGIIYEWDGTAWVRRGGSSSGGGSGEAPVTSVNGEIGEVVLDAADVGAAPLGHTHPIAEVNELQTVLDGKAAIDHNHDAQYAPIGHTHAIADVAGLQPALDAKAEKIHSHVIADVTGLQSALDEKAPVAHNHDADYVNVAGDTMTGPLTVNSHISASGNIEGVNILGTGYSLRARANDTNVSAIIQFTDHGATAQWASLVSDTPNMLRAECRVGIGTNPVGTAQLTMNGGLRFTQGIASVSDIWSGIGSTASDVISICTGNVERMRFENGRTIYADVEFGVNGTIYNPNSQLWLQGNNPSDVIVFADGGKNPLSVIKNGTGQYVALSDQRMKSSIDDAFAPGEGLKIINALLPRAYYMEEWSDGAYRTASYSTIGFISQEVEAVYSPAVDAIEWSDAPEPFKSEPLKGVINTTIIAALVQAVKDLSKQVDALSSDVSSLKSKGA